MLSKLGLYAQAISLTSAIKLDLGLGAFLGLGVYHAPD